MFKNLKLPFVKRSTYDSLLIDYNRYYESYWGLASHVSRNLDRRKVAIDGLQDAVKILNKSIGRTKHVAYN